jgi:glutamate N-acetyltransferase/amino-acid N-acetyltransferase
MSVTAPLGFRAAGVAAGIKESGRRDVAVVINDGPSRAAAGVFTANRVKAAPVLWTQQVIRGGRVRAVLLNSGGANACTGPLGFTDTHSSAERLAGRLADSAGEIAVCSTGLIGERLPMDLLLAGVDAAVADASRAGGLAAADAIRTTDTVAKIAFQRPDGYSIGGMAKGAGMLAPALATMLCVLTTDADLDAGTLDAALRAATRVSFDRLDTDGCMSTNDTVLLLASGAAGQRPSASDPNWGRVLSAVGTTDADFEPDRVNVAINGVWVCRNGCAADDRSKADLRPRDVTITVDLSAGPSAATIRTTDLTAAYVHENSAYST